MDLNQFSVDFLTPGHAAKHQPDVLSAAWGVAGSAEAGAFKSVTLEHLQPPRPAQSQPQREPGRPARPGRGEAGDGREDLHYACTCPGCPSSTSPSPFEFLKPRPPSSAPPRSGTDPSGSAAPEAGSRPRGEGTCGGSLHSCPRLPILQDGADSPFSHTHHHFHHHHCPLTSCLPCPRFLPHLSCLCCQHSLATCSREKPRETDAQPQAGKGGSVGSTPPSPLHPCMHCSASFSRPFQLLQHQRSEHAHKPPGFLCTECGRSFNSHSNLRIHLNVHTGARPYSCPDCGKSFSQSGALKIHRRIHTGERPYSCEFCSRTFPHLSAVRTHERIHTGEKPYHCGQCGKCFTQSGSLKIHTHRVHRGERPFVCSICGKRFSYQSGISFHYRTVHGLLVQHVDQAGAARGAPQRPADQVYPPGRFPPAALGPMPPDDPESDSPAETGRGRPQPDPGHQVGRARPVYTCEDCGLQFKDAPSRNKHQILIHYVSENGEDDVTTEKAGDGGGQ